MADIYLEPSVIKVAGEDPGFYHPDYVTGMPAPGGDEETWKKSHERWKIADEPYRYMQW